MEVYKKLKVLGQGSYGKVYKCRHRQSGHIVAIKRHYVEENNPLFRRMQKREIDILRQCDHENVVKLLDVLTHDKHLYLVFEFVKYSILDEFETARDGLEPTKLRKYTFQILRAVDYLHSNNIIHRDIKPDNILVSGSGVVKLCDFGLARELPSPGEPLTRGVVTLWYKAPELLVGDRLYSKPVDVWAIGCTILIMATGRVFLRGKSELDQLFKIVTKVGPLTQHHTEVLMNDRVCLFELPEVELPRNPRKKFRLGNDLLAELVDTCLQMDPGSRMSCSEMMKLPYFTIDSFPEMFIPEIQALAQNKAQVSVPSAQETTAVASVDDEPGAATAQTLRSKTFIVRRVSSPTNGNHENMEDQPKDQLEDQVDDQPKDQLEDQVEDYPENELEDRLEDQLEDQVEDQPKDQLEDQVEDQGEECPENELEDQVEDHPKNELEDRLEDQLEDQPEDQVVDQLVVHQPENQLVDKLKLEAYGYQIINIILDNVTKISGSAAQETAQDGVRTQEMVKSPEEQFKIFSSTVVSASIQLVLKLISEACSNVSGFHPDESMACAASQSQTDVAESLSSADLAVQLVESTLHRLARMSSCQDLDATCSQVDRCVSLAGALSLSTLIRLQAEHQHILDILRIRRYMAAGVSHKLQQFLKLRGGANGVPSSDVSEEAAVTSSAEEKGDPEVMSSGRDSSNSSEPDEHDTLDSTEQVVERPEEPLGEKKKKKKKKKGIKKAFSRAFKAIRGFFTCCCSSRTDDEI